MKYLKFLLSTALVIVFAVGTTMAKKVPEDKALQFATDFFKNSGHFRQEMSILKPSISTKSNSSDPKFYIVSNDEKEGFVIVSADDRFRPVLGYSLEGEIKTEKLPENLEKWLLFLCRQMEWAETNNIIDPKATAEWKNGAKAGNPVIELNTAKWGQSTPYYNECPLDGTETCVTGCVTTAVCEVMQYHKWPKTGNGIIQEYTGVWGITVPTRNLNHNYDWDNMPLTTGAFKTEAQKKAVATLMADVGAAIKSNYSKNLTDANSSNPAFYYNFGYSSDAHYDYRDYYTDDQWIRLMKNEIGNNRPVIYGGYSDDGYGHAFVMDGYDNQDYLHFNWGWEGMYDGYYLISTLDLGGFSFVNKQDAIIGFEPGDGTFKAPEHWINLAAPGMTSDENSFVKGEEFYIDKFRYRNTSILDFAGSIGLFVVDKEGNIVEELLSVEDETSTNKGYYIEDINLTITKDINEGYRIRAFYLPTGSNEWVPMWRDGVNSDVQQEILIAKDISDPLEDQCSLYIEGDQITVNVPSGTTTALYNGQTEITEGVKRTETTITVNKLTPGTKYSFHLGKDGETKEFTFMTKSID